MTHHINTWSEREVIKLKEMYLAGLTSREMSQKLQRTHLSTKAKLQRMGLRCSEERKKGAANRVNAAPERLDPIIHGTPMDLAKMELASDFYTFKGVLFYKNKVVNSIAMWHNIIRDANRKRKAEGKEQIDNWEGWVV